MCIRDRSYNYAREAKKWKQWKQKEEKMCIRDSNRGSTKDGTVKILLEEGSVNNTVSYTHLGLLLSIS